MTGFDERERAFEAKFAHDEEVRFRVHARRDKLLGLWAADKLSKTGAARQDYAMSVVVSELGRDGEAALRKKIIDDFAAAGVPLSETELSHHMTALLAEAIKQLAVEG